MMELYPKVVKLIDGRFIVKESNVLIKNSYIFVQKNTLFERICAFFMGIIEKDFKIDPKFPVGDTICFVNRQSILTEGVIESSWLGHPDGVIYIVKEIKK